MNDLIKKEKSRDVKKEEKKVAKKQAEQKPITKVQQPAQPKVVVLPKVVAMPKAAQPKVEAHKDESAKVVTPQKQIITLKKASEAKPQKPKHEHISVPLVEDKFADKEIQMNGKRIVEEAGDNNDEKKPQTMGEK